MNLLFRTPISIIRSSSAGPHRKFATRGLALLLCVPLATLGGCSQSSPPTAQNSGATPAGSTPAKAGQAPSTPGSSWMDILQRWWQVASQSRTQSGKVSVAPTPLPSAPGAPTQSEIAALATRHSAWKLADALEQNRIQPLDFESIQGSATLAGGNLAAPSFDVDLAGSPATASASSPPEQAPTGSGSTLPSPALGSPPSGLPTSGSPAPVEPEISSDTTRFVASDTIVLDLAAWQNAARDQQEDSITGFLRSVAERQSDWQRDYRQILRIALGEDVEAAAERIPASLALVMPSPEMQLEMTNLRLKLLSNVFSTPEERDATRDRLSELMTQWREKLHEQEVTRAAELKRLRVEEPAQLRSSGLTRIEDELELIQRTQQENRAAIAAEHRARLEEDFGPEQARLALTIPAIVSTTPRESTPGRSTPGAPGVLQPGIIEASRPSTFSYYENEAIPVIGNLSFMRTQRRTPSSVSGFDGVSASTITIRSARAQQIRALRQLAWRDATRQARMAKRLGY